jgi:colanic acid/amylovoran biosynthesis glycosyltransferase
VIVGRWMAREGLKHMHVHFSSTVGLIAIQVYPVTMSATIHGSDEFIDPLGFWLREKVAAASFIFAISNYGRSQLMRASDSRYWNKLEVVPLGINPAVFAPSPFRENPLPFQVFFIGRLVPVKGLQVLLAALDLLVKQGRDVRLRIIGDGPERPALEEDARHRGIDRQVIFEGRVDSARVPGLCAEADAFAMSSFAEGVPVGMMEAMAMAIPCVAPQITGIPELARDGAEALLYAASDHQGLAQAIATLMDDPALRRRIGEAGRKRILEKYNLQKNTEQLAGAFRRRLDSTGK